MIDIHSWTQAQKEEFKALDPKRQNFLIAEHCKGNFWDFNRLIGHLDMNEIHKELCSFVQSDSLASKLILMPRYSFKSSVCTIAYSLWKLANNLDERILIYSDATSKAIGFLNSIKAHIEGKVKGSLFRSVYGAWETDSARGGKWNEDQIVVSIRGTSYPEPSVDTGGIETSKVAFHYDTIIFDDIVSDKNITTKDQMDKVAECYKKALSLLKPGGRVLITGTRWHFGDLYGRIIAENDVKKSFIVFLKQAEKDEKYGEYPFSNIGLTREFLTKQKVEQGSSIYSCIYQNNPVSDETSVFKLENFAFYGRIKTDDLYITVTCDPAGEGEDFTAITTVGTDSNMDMHVLDVINEHLQPSEIVEKIINLQYKYKFQILGCETNFFRGMLEAEIKRRRDQEHKENPEKFRLFGVHEFEASSRRGTGKHTRIMALQPFHERGAIKFPGERLELLEKGFSELGWQMVQYTHDGAKSPHDDAIDSLAYHVTLIRKGGLVKKNELPINSPAWLERKMLDKDFERNNKLPRKFRRRINLELAFS